MTSISGTRAGITPRTFQLICRRGIANLPNRKAFTRKPSSGQSKKKADPILYPPPTAPTVTTLGRKERKGRIIEQHPKSDDDGTADGIHWFEEDMHTGKRVRVNEDPEEKERLRVIQEIKQVEFELKGYETNDPDRFLDDGFLQALSPGDRAKINRLRQVKQAREQRVLKDLTVEVGGLEKHQLPYLNAFNRTLRKVALLPQKVEYRPLLWKAYRQAKSIIGAERFLEQLSPRAWNVLGNILPVHEPSRSERIIVITNDKKMVNASLSAQDQSSRVLALWELGDRAQAYTELQMIERMPSKSPEVLDMLVRMYAEVGDVDKGVQTMGQLQPRFPDQFDPRVVIPLVRAAAQAGKDQLAFGLYVLMRERLDEDITMKDYDEMTFAFLSSGKKDLALAVFRDMMLQGSHDRNISIQDSRSQHKDLYKAIAARVDTFIRLGKTSEDVNQFSLTAIGALPRAWQNKFFYASWLKKLIGMERIDEAVQVLELMCERGAKPSAMHVNGIIGAIFREGNEERVKMAEELAWAAIRKRMDQAWERRSSVRRDRQQIIDQVRWGSVVVAEDNSNQPDFQHTDEKATDELVSVWQTRELPPATLETFSVLVLHYLLQGKYNKMQDVHWALSLAEIKADIYFINQVLQGIFYQHGAPRMWEKFLQYTQPGNPQPNVHTYRFHWETQVRVLRRLRFANVETDAKRFPSPRALFADMARWLRASRISPVLTIPEDGLPPQVEPPNTATNESDEDGGMGGMFQTWILQSFGLSKDLPGTLVALHACYQLFNRTPNHTAEDLICLTIAAFPVAQRETARGRQRGKQRQYINASEKNLEGVKNIYNSLVDSRARAWAESRNLPISGQNARIEFFKGRAGGINRLEVLTDLIRLVLGRVHASTSSNSDGNSTESVVNDLVKEAAEEMGVPGLDIVADHQSEKVRDAGRAQSEEQTLSGLGSGSE